VTSGRLTLTNDHAELNRLTALLEALAGRVGLSEAEFYALSLALEEVVLNVMDHAYGPGVAKPIEVGYRVQGRTATLTVIDWGPAFNPLAVPSPDPDQPLEERSVGGLGIFLVRKYMDRIDYARVGETNVLTLVKRLGQAPGKED
jgi:serine/threonine-protein kinase RsbW